jgi:hypothetical protein
MNRLNSDSKNIDTGKKLKDFFYDLDYTNQYIADKFGVPRIFINKLLNGKPFGKDADSPGRKTDI